MEAKVKRRSSVAVKLHKSTVKLKNISLSDAKIAATASKDNIDAGNSGTSSWTSKFPFNIAGHTEESRAKNLDGGYFEDFVILDYQHEDQMKQASQNAAKQDESLKAVSELSFLEISVSSHKEVSNKEAEFLYLDILHIVRNQLGKRAFGKETLTDGDLYVYGQQVLDISTEQHRRLYSLAKRDKVSESYLKVIVKEARNLEAKDANGLSDPYCMLTLIEAGAGDKPSKDGKKINKTVLRDLSDEVTVRTTRIKSNTLAPVWDESYVLKIGSYNKEVLRLEIWDHDDSSVFLDGDNRITSIRGFSGVGRFIKEVVQSTKCNETTADDFLGIVEIPLKEIPSTGLDDWFQLMGRSSKSHVQGDIHLKLEFLGRFELGSSEENNSASVKLCRQLWERFVLHDAKEYLNEHVEEVYWDTVSSPHAKCLLNQHAVQTALTKFQLLVCEWEAMTKCQKEVPIPMTKFVDLTSRFKIYSTCQGLDIDEEKVFIDSLDDFFKYCYQLVEKYRSLYPASVPEKCLSFGKMLLCLMTLYRLPIFQNFFPRRRLIPDMELALKESTLKWFATTEAYYEPNQRSAQEEMTSLVNLVNAVNVDLVRASSYTSLFKVIGIDYYSFIYNFLEKQIMQKVKPELEKLSRNFGYGIENDNIGTAMFQLYTSLRDLANHKQQVPERFKTENGVENYYSWFQGSVGKWLDLAKEKAIMRIKKAVEIDEVRVVHSNLKYSASAVDVTCCLGQICTFWENLRWPDPYGSYGFVTKITDILSSAIVEYGKIMLMKLKSVGYYDTIGRFDISEKLCISMNNLEHVLFFLDNIPTVLKYEEIIMELCEKCGEDRSEYFRSTLMKILECAKDDLKSKLSKAMNKIGDKMKPDIMDFLDKIVVVSQGKGDYEAVDPLLEYLDENLITLNDTVLEPVFDKMLRSFWDFFLASLDEFVQKSSKSRRDRFAVLLDVVEQIREFFVAEGKGIPSSELYSADAQKIEHTLYLYGAQTEVVIQDYYKIKCQEQMKAVEKFGALEFKVFYSHQNQALHISIAHARNLLPLDQTGSSDPFISMELLPKHIFPDQVEQKTSVKNSTLFPVFDDNFSFEIQSIQCLQNGATLVLTVYDKDLVSENDIGGEVFFDLNNTFGLEKDVSAGFSNIEGIELPLIHGSVNDESFKVLQARTDPKATSFVQQRMAKYRKMEHDVIRGRKISLQLS